MIEVAAPRFTVVGVVIYVPKVRYVVLLQVAMDALRKTDEPILISS
jgi:hypothetical protein